MLQISQSIAGEELPYVFGAPLASTSPFQSKFTPQERLLSESVMVYWTNFAKTGYCPNRFYTTLSITKNFYLQKSKSSIS